MIVTTRFIWLFASGAIFYAIGGSQPFWNWIGVFYHTLLVCFATMDWYLLTPFSLIDLKRECNDRLSLGTPNPVRWTVKNRGTRRISLTLKDEPPVDFAISKREEILKVESGQSLQTTYSVVPHHRGDYQFGALHLRLQTPLGLDPANPGPANQTVRVYPNFRKMEQYNLMTRRGRLKELGIRTVRRLGQGTEFESLRDYNPDDEFRQINWKASARKGRLISQQYQIERSRTIMLVVDAGRMMTVPSGNLSRLDRAINAALMVAYVAVTLDDQVGLLVFAEEIQAYLPPRKGKKQVHRILEALYRIEARKIEPDYAEVVKHLKTHLDKRSLTLMFTDLTDQGSSSVLPTEELPLVSSLCQLRPAHLVICATSRPGEIEALASQFPGTADHVYQKVAADQVLAGRERLIHTLTCKGIRVVDASGDELTAGVISRYLELKGRM